nr:hypothetical protein [Tanacetum cinerariifolium]
KPPRMRPMQIELDDATLVFVVGAIVLMLIYFCVSWRVRFKPDLQHATTLREMLDPATVLAIRPRGHRRWADAIPAHVDLLGLRERFAVGAVGDDVVRREALRSVQLGRLQHPQPDVDDHVGRSLEHDGDQAKTILCGDRRGRLVAAAHVLRAVRCRHQLLLTAGIRDGGYRVLEAFRYGGVEAAVHLRHERGGDAHGVRRAGGALIVAAAGDGRQRLVQRFAFRLVQRLHRLSRPVRDRHNKRGRVVDDELPNALGDSAFGGVGQLILAAENA